MIRRKVGRKCSPEGRRSFREPFNPWCAGIMFSKRETEKNHCRLQKSRCVCKNKAKSYRDLSTKLEVWRKKAKSREVFHHNTSKNQKKTAEKPSNLDELSIPRPTISWPHKIKFSGEKKCQWAHHCKSHVITVSKQVIEFTYCRYYDRC